MKSTVSLLLSLLTICVRRSQMVSIQSSTRPPRRSDAFTLIELLAATAIIAILIALVFPVAGAIASRAQVAKCTANLRAIAPAFQSYLTDNDMSLPWRFEHDERIGYKERLAEYLNHDLTVFQCPSHRELLFPAQSSYGMNYFYDHANVLRVDRPSQTILLAEVAGASGRGSHRAHRDSESPGQLDPERHRGKANYLFFDGSVRSLEYNETIRPRDLWGENIRQEEPG